LAPGYSSSIPAKGSIPGQKYTRQVTNAIIAFSLYTFVQKGAENFFCSKFGFSSRQAKTALLTRHGIHKRSFEEKVKQRGREILDNLTEYNGVLFLLGRPYNTSDAALNLRLVQKMIRMEILPIPVDFLPVENINVFESYSFNVLA